MGQVPQPAVAASAPYFSEKAAFSADLKMGGEGGYHKGGAKIRCPSCRGSYLNWLLFMPENASVSIWLEQLKTGDRDSVGPLLDRFFQRLVALAGSRLRGQSHLAGYEEDVALSAFKSLCLGAEKGRYPNLDTRDELWRLLAVITVRKAIDIQRRKRLEQGINAGELAEYFARDPSPDEVVEMTEQVRVMLNQLQDPELQQIALWKVEGHSNEDIARRLQCVVRTVERKLHQIRLHWQTEANA